MPGIIKFLLFYDPSHNHQIIDIVDVLNNQLLSIYGDKFKLFVASLPSYADLNNWKNNTVLSSNELLIGGLIIDKSCISDSHNNNKDNKDNNLENNNSNETAQIIIYIGDKSEQIKSISLYLSKLPMIYYSPIHNDVSILYGEKSVDFTQRTGGMLKVKNANTIGIIIGSMGLTEINTQLILKRLQTLIHISGRKYYTFAMGRLNEAKLSNFPEIDIFCLVSNDDAAIIPSK